jgi:threonine dehydratase
MDLNLTNVEKAARSINRVFLDSPQFVDEQLSRGLGRRTLVKVETLNPIRSFKGRGTDFLIRGLDPKQRVVCASAGNFGQAVAYSARDRAMAAEVFVSTDVNPIKLARIQSFGAVATVAGADFDAAKELAREHAAQRAECVFIEDGVDPAISEGAGTIAVELLRAGTFDAVVIPVGDGALITGMALWIKQHSPGTRIVGVCPSGAPAMLKSWRAGKPIAIVKADTFADGIATRVPVGKSVERMKELVDDMVEVSDAQMLDAMRLAASTLGLLLEPSGAAGLAAIRAKAVEGDFLATVLTGSNIHPDLVPRVLAGAERS